MEKTSEMFVPPFNVTIKEEPLDPMEVCEALISSIKQEQETELNSSSVERQPTSSSYYVCLLCKVKFGSFRLVCEHVDLKHSLAYKCKVQECSQSLKSIALYRTHMLKTHTIRITDGTMLKLVQAAKIVAQNSYVGSCSCILCPQNVDISQLHSHVQNCHQSFCRTCGIDFESPTNFAKHFRHRRGYIKNFNCSECKLQFKTIDLIKSHLANVHPEKLDSGNNYTRCVKKLSKTSMLPSDCPFCEVKVLSKDFQTHISSHSNGVCKGCLKPVVDLTSVTRLCVVCSDRIHPSQPESRVTQKIKKSRKKTLYAKKPQSTNCCKGCQTPTQGSQTLCAQCRISEKYRSTRVCLSLSEFSECERRCTECRATLWSYKFIQICLNCLPRDVASLDINLSIVPQPLPKPGLEKKREELKLGNIASTNKKCKNEISLPLEPIDEIFSPVDPQSENNSDSELVDFDDHVPSVPSWIETTPDAIWSSRRPVATPVPCDYCPKTFPHRFALRDHMQESHPEYRSSICAWCRKQFKTRAVFLRHRAVHRSDLGCLCEVCGERLLDGECLKTHMLKHAPRDQFLCPHCGKQSKTKRLLHIHKMNSHTEKLMLCQHCPKKFRIKSRIESHMQTHTGDFMYRCKMCKAKFTRSDNLRQHMKNNHNFACPICDLTLPTAAEVRRHRGEAHTREQLEASQAQGEGEFVRFTPFQCSVCSRFLASKQSLDKHLTTHRRSASRHDKKPFSGNKTK